MKYLLIITITLLAAVSRSAFALSPALITDNLAIPWGMVFVSEQQLLMTEKQGGLKVVDTASGQITDIAGAPVVSSSGQGGLLDVAVRPDYQSDDWLYFTYSRTGQNGQAGTELARAKLDLNQHMLKDWQVLLSTESYSSTGRHFGSRIAFSDSHLFFSVGDRGHRPNGQDLTTHAGSILRLNVDGSVPADNPFVGAENALPEIWSYGHRNPQGLAYDAENKRLWAIEHGPRGGDEINLIEKGKNYGWPVVSLGKEYLLPKKVGKYSSHPYMVDPLKAFIPSIAPGSLLLYKGGKYPELEGALLSGALKLAHLNAVSLDGAKVVSEQRYFEDMQRRIRALAVDNQGYLYFATDNGELWRVEP